MPKPKSPPTSRALIVPKAKLQPPPTQAEVISALVEREKAAATQRNAAAQARKEAATAALEKAIVAALPEQLRTCKWTYHYGGQGVEVLIPYEALGVANLRAAQLQADSAGWVRFDEKEARQRLTAAVRNQRVHAMLADREIVTALDQLLQKLTTSPAGALPAD